MSTHGTEIVWRSDGQYCAGHYSRAHEWRFDGGQVVRGSSSPHVVPEPMSDPFGVDPEEALVASVASCHMLWFLDLARRDGWDVVSYRDAAAGVMGRTGAGRFALTRITLRPEIGFAGRQPDATELRGLHHRAHDECFIANSLRTEIVIEPVLGTAPPALIGQSPADAISSTPAALSSTDAQVSGMGAPSLPE